MAMDFSQMDEYAPILLNKTAVRFEKQPYHMLTPSPWPFMLSWIMLSDVLILVMYLNKWRLELFDPISPILTVMILFIWFSDIIMESFSHHTTQVVKCLKAGFKLFMTSEAMLFFSLFWAFFHYSVSPSVWIGAMWPPLGVLVMNPWGLPFLNTVVLLSSGISLTLAHRALLLHSNMMLKSGLIVTIFLAVNFLSCQLFEYKNAPFSMNSSVYGSIFYMMTGFHGFHVIVGFIFLVVCVISAILNHFSTTRHIGFEVAAWYWHFVDIIWIFLWVCLYLWGF